MSISLYNEKGYFQKNSLNAYSLNNLTAKPNSDGSYTLRFGGRTTKLPADHDEGLELRRAHV